MVETHKDVPEPTTLPPGGDYLHKYSVGHILAEGPASLNHYLQIFYSAGGGIEKKLLDSRPTSTTELDKLFGAKYMLKVYERCNKKGIEDKFSHRPGVSRMTSDEQLKEAPHSVHYKHEGGIEPIEFIEANDLGFHLGNVIKYVHRVRWHKIDEDPFKCIDKAIWYLQRKRELMNKR